MLPDLIALWPLALLVLLTTLFTEWAVHAKVLPYWISRKILHIIAVGSCAFAPYFVVSHWSLIAVVLPAFSLLLVLVAGKKLMLDENGRPAWGIVWFPLAYLILLAFFELPEQVCLPMLILAVCDPSATIFGKLFGGKTTYQLTGEPKSLVGSLAFFVSFITLSLLFFGFDYFAHFSWLFVLVITGLLLTIAEALGSYGRDNLYVPLLAAILFNAGQLDFIDGYLLHFILLVAYPFYRFTTRRNSLSKGGALAAILLGTSIVIVAGSLFLLPLVVFFATSVLIGKLFPHQTISDNKDKQPRDAVQVICNGGVYLLLGVLYSYADARSGAGTSFWLDFNSLDPASTGVAEFSTLSNAWMRVQLPRFTSLALISIAISTADTWASEIGQYFRQPTYDLLRFQRVEPGLSGGVSVSGTLAALVGAALIASLGFLFGFGYDWGDFLLITLGGFSGMLVDSVLGSALQRQYHDGTRWTDLALHQPERTRGLKWVTNDAVNLLANAITVLFFLLLA